MNKAFIFDMDGVIIDNEELWGWYEQNEIFPKLFGKDLGGKIGSTTGMGLSAIYDKAVSLGFKMSKEKYLTFWNEAAEKIYKTSPITPEIDDLGKYLVENNFKLGIVSASPLKWINWVMDRLNFKDKFEIIISLDDRPDLKYKPSPDGYNEAINILDVTPETTIILEDSNMGIKAARASGSYTIAFSENLPSSYKQTETANAYAANIREVLGIVKKWNPSH